MVKLTKNEAKFRRKIIQERHLNKWEQKTMDRAKIKYKWLYENWEFSSVGYTIAAERLCRSFASVGIKAGELAGSVGLFSETIRTLTGYMP